MQIPKVLLDEEKAKQFFKYSLAFSLGGMLGSYIGLREFKKFTKRVKAQTEMLRMYREEIRRIQADVTLSGQEREEKIETIIKFVELILDQDLT